MLKTSLLTLVLVAAALPVRADYIGLKSGGEIRGELLTDPKKPARGADVSIRTLSGATVTVVRDEVDGIVRRRLILEDYETRRRAVPDSALGHWELAEWCRSNALSQERLVHLRLVVEFDPEHVAAHRGLGHVMRQGKWTSIDEMLASRGFVKHKGKRVLPQELELTLQDQRIGEAEKSWLKRIKLWQGWLVSDRGDRRTKAATSLRAIHDPHAVPALVRSFRDAPVEEHRLLYIEILSKIEGERPVFPMVVQSLVDESKGVRETAISGVRRKDPARAMVAYFKALKNRHNLIVNRAAEALGQIGDDAAIAPLIDALVTRHEHQTLVEDSNPLASTEANDNRTGIVIPAGVEPSTDAERLSSEMPVEGEDTDLDDERIPVIYEKDHQNESVLVALNLLTRQNFSYDSQAWRQWYNARINAARTK